MPPLPPPPHPRLPRCALLAPVRLIAPSDARAALQKAATLVQQGRLDEADRQAQLALADPDTRRRRVLGPRHDPLPQKRLDESATLLQKAIELEPRLVGAHLSLAQVYIAQGKLGAGDEHVPRRCSSSIHPNAHGPPGAGPCETAKGNYQQSWTWRSLPGRS